MSRFWSVLRATFSLTRRGAARNSISLTRRGAAPRKRRAAHQAMYCSACEEFCQILPEHDGSGQAGILSGDTRGVWTHRHMLSVKRRPAARFKERRSCIFCVEIGAQRGLIQRLPHHLWVQSRTDKPGEPLEELRTSLTAISLRTGDARIAALAVAFKLRRPSAKKGGQVSQFSARRKSRAIWGITAFAVTFQLRGP